MFRLSWTGSMNRRINLVFLAVLLAVAAVRRGHASHARRPDPAECVGVAGPRPPRRGRQGPGKSRAIAEPVPEDQREDGAAWEWYARVVDQHDSDRRQRDRVLLVHEQALRYNPGDSKLERRCADLALELARYYKAEASTTTPSAA